MDAQKSALIPDLWKIFYIEYALNCYSDKHGLQRMNTIRLWTGPDTLLKTIPLLAAFNTLPSAGSDFDYSAPPNSLLRSRVS